MAYYDTIRSQSTFSTQAKVEKAENFESLYNSKTFPQGVSLWGREHLFASRLLCKKPQKRLSLFADGDFFPASAEGKHECIDRLIAGPDTILYSMSEPQIVQLCRPDSLGYVWAALAQFRRETEISTTDRSKSTRNTAPVDHYGDYTHSGSYQIGSSSPTGPPSTSSASGSDYIPRTPAPPFEELAVRLASCFIRCVVNYSQPLDKTLPFIHYRDQRLTSSYTPAHLNEPIRAFDDGGLQLINGDDILQVANLEGKRSFQAFPTDGKPTISDRTLGQITGEILALRRAPESKPIASNQFVTILAVERYIKFLSFEIPDGFVEKYENLSPASPRQDENSYLSLSSTDWFDTNVSGHQKEIVLHVLALVAWANAQTDGGSDDESMDM